MNSISTADRDCSDPPDLSPGELPPAQLQAIFDSALDAILVTDGDGRYTAANPAAGELLGAPPHEIVGRTVADFSVEHFDVPTAWSAFLEIGRARGQFQLRRADGEIRDVEYCAVANIGPGRHLSVLRDVTAAKKNEAALIEASHQKDQFLAALSHELRNPIGAVSVAVQTLQRFGPLEPRLKSARDIIERQIGHLTRLVEDLLDVSRAVFGKMELQRADIPADAAISLGLETVAHKVESRGQRLVVSLPQAAVRVNADLNRLGQVISNLVHNASRFSGDGARIWVTLETDKACAILRVRDEGMGIVADKLGSIFEPFAQFEPSRRQLGLGLGLVLVRTVVELHGGKVSVFSGGSGQGSEFVVRLPIATTKSGDVAIPALNSSDRSPELNSSVHPNETPDEAGGGPSTTGIHN